LCCLLLLPGIARAQGIDSADTDTADIEIEVDADAPAPADAVPTPPANPPAQPEPSLADVEALRAQLNALEARLAAVEALAPVPEEPSKPSIEEQLAVRFTGYVQPQVVFSELSEDELDPEGEPLNEDRFVIRRARLRADRDFVYARAALEIDANTVDGAEVTVKRVEAAALYPSATDGAPPLAMLTAGLSDIPLGYELQESSRERPFMERSVGSRALFPSEYDVGAKLTGGLGPLRYALAVQNGAPIEGGNSVYTEERTFLGWLGFASGKPGALRLNGGVGYLAGTGLHLGTPATKSQLLWSDDNQDGVVTLSELEAVNGQAATTSATFERWAVSANLGLAFSTAVGESRVFAEATMASNLDRGYFVADPVSTGYDLREVAWAAGAVQDLGPWAFIGFRADQYDPNSDAFDTRRGEFVPQDVSILTLAPVVGARWTEIARLVLQYDYVVDHLSRDDLGQPVDLANDRWTLRAQVAF
jgi:hypothetical protein